MYFYLTLSKNYHLFLAKRNCEGTLIYFLFIIYFNLFYIFHYYRMDAWNFYCVTGRFDVECGNDVKNAISEILDHTGYMHPSCREVKNELSHFQEAFISEFRKGKHGQAAVPGILESIAKKLD